MSSFNKQIKQLLLGVSLTMTPVLGFSEILFEENFDEQPDWTSTMHSTVSGQRAVDGFVLPQDWDAIYQGTHWSPETGFPNKHASLEILERNEAKARGGAGRSAVFWRESYSRGWNNWASDAQLIKALPTEHKTLYVEFWIRFADDWYGRNEAEAGSWTSKIFRVGSWDGEGDMFNGAAGAIGPLFLWDWKRDSYGVRNVLAYRGGPHGENYGFNNEYVRDESRNFSSMTLGYGSDGSDPELLDRVYGGLLKTFSGPVSHDQVFGREDSWTKVSFYLAMNSSPGAKDGVMKQWVNGTQIFERNDIPWVMSNVDNKMVGWNYIAIGGNDYFQAFPNDQQYEDWYSIDDVVVRTDIPEDLADSSNFKSPPKPPQGIGVK